MTSNNSSGNPPSAPFSFQVDTLSLGKLVGNPILDVLNACSRSNLQPLALLALADLGASILPDTDLIQKAKAVFETPRRIIIDKFKVRLGLDLDPVSKHMQESSHFAAAFLLAVGCKPVLSVDETAALLHQMIKQCLKPPNIIPSLNQLADVLAHINGYGDLIKATSADQIWVELSCRIGSANSLLEIDRLHSSTILAEIIEKTFEALRDTDNQQVIIRGCTCGLLIATILLWLCPSCTACAVDGIQVYPVHDVNIRLIIDIQKSADPWRWQMVKQRTETSLPQFLAQFTRNEQKTKLSYHGYYPLQSAKSMINRALDETKARAIGLLATSLVEVAFEDGQLVSTSSNRQLAPAEKVKKTIANMCPDNAFAKKYTSVMIRFGWSEDEVNTKDRSRITELLRRSISSANIDASDLRYDQETGSWLDHRTSKSLLTSILFRSCGEFQIIDNAFMLLSDIEDFAEVVEYSVSLAMQALFLFTFNPQLSDYLKFVRPSIFRIRMYEKVMVKLLVRFDQMPRMEAKSTLDMLSQMEFGEELGFLEFRSHAMSHMLPGASFNLSLNSLAVSSNGYVVYSAVFDFLAEPKYKSQQATVHQTTNRWFTEDQGSEISVTQIDDEREAAWGLWVIPGQIQWHDRPQGIKEIGDMYFREPGGEALPEPQSPINPFSQQGAYLGLNERSAKNHGELIIRHSVGISQELGMRGPGIDYHHVTMAPYITATNVLVPPSEVVSDLGELPSNPRLHLSWIESIQAWAFAEYVVDSYTSKRMEEDNSRRWKLKGYFQSDVLQWCPMNRDCKDTRVIVSSTNSAVSSPEMRFFEPGHAMLGRHHIRKVFIRYGTASLVDCLLSCLSQEDVATGYSSIIL